MAKLLDPEKQLVIIMTDGYENSSKEYSQIEMKKLIEELTGKGNWTFVYLGANQDAYAEARKYGIPTGNTVTFNATGKGMRSSMTNTAGATMDYAASMNSNTTAFYSAEQRKDIEEAK